MSHRTNETKAVLDRFKRADGTIELFDLVAHLIVVTESIKTQMDYDPLEHSRRHREIRRRIAEAHHELRECTEQEKRLPGTTGERRRRLVNEIGQLGLQLGALNRESREQEERDETRP